MENKVFVSKNDRSKWPARPEFDRSSPRSGRTLSVDRPLFAALYYYCLEIIISIVIITTTFTIIIILLLLLLWLLLYRYDKINVIITKSNRIFCSRSTCIHWNGFSRQRGQLWFQCSIARSFQVCWFSIWTAFTLCCLLFFVRRTLNRLLKIYFFPKVSSFLSRWIKQSEKLEAEASQPDPGPKLDLSFKEGQTIHINLGVSKVYLLRIGERIFRFF